MASPINIFLVTSLEWNVKNKFRRRWDSNPRPPAFAASVLPLDHKSFTIKSNNTEANIKIPSNYFSLQRQSPNTIWHKWLYKIITELIFQKFRMWLTDCVPGPYLLLGQIPPIGTTQTLGKIKNKYYFYDDLIKYKNSYLRKLSKAYFPNPNFLDSICFPQRHQPESIRQLVETPESIRNWLLRQCRLKSFFEN